MHKASFYWCNYNFRYCIRDRCAYWIHGHNEINLTKIFVFLKETWTKIWPKQIYSVCWWIGSRCVHMGTQYIASLKSINPWPSYLRKRIKILKKWSRDNQYWMLQELTNMHGLDHFWINSKPKVAELADKFFLYSDNLQKIQISINYVLHTCMYIVHHHVTFLVKCTVINLLVFLLTWLCVCNSK